MHKNTIIFTNYTVLIGTKHFKFMIKDDSVLI